MERSNEEIPWGDERPRTRGDCVGRPRPCPWVGCKYHLLVDVKAETGAIIVNAGRTTERVEVGGRTRLREITRRVGTVSLKQLETAKPREGSTTSLVLERAEEQIFTALESAAWTGAPTCVLDVADAGEALTLEEVGSLLSLTRERIRQIELKAYERCQTPDAADALEGYEDSAPGPDAWEAAGL